MRREKYSMGADTNNERYQFVSTGPKGKIIKVVAFKEVQPNIYNIGFGDWDENNLLFSDNTRSNNGDRNKVLATVAGTIIEFFRHHTDAVIYAEGATKARTRLYQMEINKHWDEISLLFNVNGWINGRWEPFKNNKNYEAFALKKK